MSRGEGEDLKIDDEALKGITEGLRAAISELEGIGGGKSGSLIGAGFSELALTSMEAGHNGLAKDFEDFCESWEWGVRALVQDANALARRTGIAAGLYYENEQYINGTFKVVANNVAGNPHLSEEEAQGKDWDELFSRETYRADYSGESFQQAWDESKQTWQAVADSNRSGLADAAPAAAPDPAEGDR
ncbi:hypothetical protein [Streptomyces pactum]|uniref:hypothetical protein n=1 Tax=Streptomyces pactum TaxID=68249 RepID=UPI0037009292